jgi:hypothetical protein
LSYRSDWRAGFSPDQILQQEPVAFFCVPGAVAQERDLLFRRQLAQQPQREFLAVVFNGRIAAIGGGGREELLEF